MRFYSIIYILLTASAFEVSRDCGRVLVPRGGFYGFPRIVMIMDHESEYRITCVGSLLSPSVVVTEVNCFYNETSRSKINANRRVVGAYDPTETHTYQISKIKTIHLAGVWQGRRFQYTKVIAWLILENPFNITGNVGTVCVDFNYEYKHEDLQSEEVDMIIPRSEPLSNAQECTIVSRVECLWNPINEVRSSVTDDKFCVRAPFEYNAARDEEVGTFSSEHRYHWYNGCILTRKYREVRGHRINGTVINIGQLVDEIKRNVGKKNYECGIVTLPVNPLIVGGYRAELGGFPWHVAVYQKNLTGFYDQICGGSLISLNVVISAAHCFYDESLKLLKDANNYAVAAGKHKRPYNWLERFVQKSPIETIHISNRYYGIDGLYAGDIAWLVLKNPFYLSAFVTPICLESNSQDVSARLQDGQVGKVAGWGLTAGDISSHVLQEMTASVVSYNVCISTLPRDARPYVTTDKFCAGYLNGTMLCNGDSGGGLVFQRDGHWYLRGIVSVNPVVSMTCNTTGYTAFTDVVRYTDELFRFTNITTHDLI